MNELSVTRGVLIVAMLVLATAITRFLPFLLFPAGKKCTAAITVLLKLLLPCPRNTLCGRKNYLSRVKLPCSSPWATSF